MGVGSDFNRLESVFGHVHLYLLDMWNKLVSKGAAKWTIIETQGFMDLVRKRLPANTVESCNSKLGFVTDCFTNEKFLQLQDLAAPFDTSLFHMSNK